MRLRLWILFCVFSQVALGGGKGSLLTELKGAGNPALTSSLLDAACHGNQKYDGVVFQPAGSRTAYLLAPEKSGLAARPLWLGSEAPKQARVGLSRGCGDIPPYFVQKDGYAYGMSGRHPFLASGAPGKDPIADAKRAQENLKLHLAEVTRFKPEAREEGWKALFPELDESLRAAVDAAAQTDPSSLFPRADKLLGQLRTLPAADKIDQSAGELRKDIDGAWKQLTATVHPLMGNARERERFSRATNTRPKDFGRAGFTFAGTEEAQVTAQIEKAFFGPEGRHRALCRAKDYRFVAVYDSVWGKRFVDCVTRSVMNPVEWNQFSRWIEGNRFTVEAASTLSGTLARLRRSVDDGQLRQHVPGKLPKMPESVGEDPFLACTTFTAPVEGWKHRPEDTAAFRQGYPHLDPSAYVRAAPAGKTIQLQGTELPDAWKGLTKLACPGASGAEVAGRRPVVRTTH